MKCCSACGLILTTSLLYFFIRNVYLFAVRRISTSNPLAAYGGRRARVRGGGSRYRRHVTATGTWGPRAQRQQLASRAMLLLLLRTSATIHNNQEDHDQSKTKIICLRKKFLRNNVQKHVSLLDRARFRIHELLSR